MKTTKLALLAILTMFAFSSVVPVYAQSAAVGPADKEEVTLTWQDRFYDFSECEFEDLTLGNLIVGSYAIGFMPAGILGHMLGYSFDKCALVVGSLTCLGVVTKYLFDQQRKRLENKKQGLAPLPYDTGTPYSKYLERV